MEIQEQLDRIEQMLHTMMERSEPNTEDILGVPEVAAMLGVSQTKVHRLARSNAIPHTRSSGLARGHYRFRRGDVLAYAEMNKRRNAEYNEYTKGGRYGR